MMLRPFCFSALQPDRYTVVDAAGYVPQLGWLKGVLADPEPERVGAILGAQGQPEYYAGGRQPARSVRPGSGAGPIRVILVRDGQLEPCACSAGPLVLCAATPSRRTANLPQVDTSVAHWRQDGGRSRVLIVRPG